MTKREILCLNVKLNENKGNWLNKGCLDSLNVGINANKPSETYSNITTVKLNKKFMQLNMLKNDGLLLQFATLQYNSFAYHTIKLWYTYN